MKNLPNLAFFAFLLALSFDLCLGIPAILVFLAVVVGLFLIGYITSRSKANTVIRISGGEALRLSVDLTPSGTDAMGCRGPGKRTAHSLERYFPGGGKT